MMSTALLMAVGDEQTKMRSAASDRVESGEMSFAQSFGERVGLAVDVQTMNSTGDASSEVPGGKSSEAQKSDTPSVASKGVKANAVADRRITKLDETTGMAMTTARGTGNSLPVETDLVARVNASDRGQSKTTSGQLPADSCELQQDIAAQVGHSPTKTAGATTATVDEELLEGNLKEAGTTSSIVSNDVLTTEPTTLDSLHEGTAVADRWLLSHGAVESPVAIETMLAGKALEVNAAKKGAKAQESTVGAKPTSKTNGRIESEKVVGDASNVAGVPSVITLPIQASTPGDAQPNAAGVATANATGVFGSTSGKLAGVTWTAGPDNTGRKTIARAAKEEVEAAGPGADPTAGMPVATGFGAEIAKAVAVASTAGKDADEKGLGAVGAATLARVVGGSEAAAAGVVPGMASGHTPAEVGGTKTQAGEVGAHAATVQTGLGEQDGFDGAAVEMGMSHRTLLATPTALEVGVANGTQGWLKIRAETTDGGVVTASLSSATSAGQETLHRELPSLIAYLQEERVAVNTFVVATPAGTESRFSGGMNGEGRGQPQQGSHSEGGDGRQGSIPGVPDRAAEIPTYMALNGVGEDELLSAGTYAGGGSWLNVRI
jgi:hypothetical protein